MIKLLSWKNEGTFEDSTLDLISLDRVMATPKDNKQNETKTEV